MARLRAARPPRLLELRVVRRLVGDFLYRLFQRLGLSLLVLVELGLVRRDDGRDRTASDLDLDVLGDEDVNLLVVDGDDVSVDPARGDDLVAGLQVRKQILMAALVLAL